MDNNKGRKKKEIGFDSPFATRLRDLLAETNTTQPTLAAAVGVSRQAVGQWKDGNTVPDILDFQKIADYFGVSLEFLAGRSENKTTDIKIQAISDYTNLSESAINTLHSDFKELNTQLIASIAFKDKDAESNSFYNYFYFYHENLGKCISTLLDHKEGVDLLNFIQHYIVLKTTDTKINCDSILSALHLEILERLKQMRDKQNRP